jgi:hypothetical protein
MQRHEWKRALSATHLSIVLRNMEVNYPSCKLEYLHHLMSEKTLFQLSICDEIKMK